MLQVFHESIRDARNLRLLYTHCVLDLKLPGDYSDLLRMDIVYCMSALDKLIHDIVNFEMVEVYAGRRNPTQKYLSEPISLMNHAMHSTMETPSQITFDGIVRLKLKHQSFLDPAKLVDALGLVWQVQDKWLAISNAMQRDRKDVMTELKSIFQRRNSIVHEADKDPISNNKYPISVADTMRVEEFIETLGDTVHNLVR
ncbi:HEPN domain-containing protein [Aeromonas caviae]|uniref:RiboL-PSP-HEPN domain-containing protein n=1 Tax=Aeromonas caviae TaxID=648 RepID=A0A7T3X036_AERCA|nr:HEPN domain-containing protein [Aeromonas caviae]QQA59767.1 hypothetical protein JC965_16135 [Aeromonas caviae]